MTEISSKAALPPDGAAVRLFGCESAAAVKRGVQRLAKLRLTAGTGPEFFRVGRSIYYRIEDLDAYMLSNRRRSTSDVGLQHAAA